MRTRTSANWAAAAWTPEELPPAELPVDGDGDAEAASADAAARAMEHLVADARTRGYEEGRRAGERAEAERLRTAVRALEDAAETFNANAAPWLGALEENLCALATAIARQLLTRELASDGTLVAALVRRALAEFPLGQPVRISLNPVDLAAITGLAEQGAAAPMAAGREARWVADPTLAPGGCVVEGVDRVVDGRVETALENIYRRLTRATA